MSNNAPVVRTFTSCGIKSFIVHKVEPGNPPVDIVPDTAIPRVGVISPFINTWSVKVVDPLRVPEGTYQLFVCDENYIWTRDSATQVYTSNKAPFSALGCM